MGSKSDLRSHFKNMLSALSCEREVRSQLICSRLDEFIINLNLPKFSYLGVFDPLDDEVDWKSLKLSPEVKLVYPRFIESGQMDFAEVNEKNLSHSFGVELLEPHSSAPPKTPDVILVPALAFDKKGYRLGRGAGFYDRYLANYKGLSIGICFKECVIKELPRKSHDVPVDYVVSEEGVFKREV